MGVQDAAGLRHLKVQSRVDVVGGRIERQGSYEELQADPLVREVYLPARGGTLQPALVAAARERGRVPVAVGDLEGLLAEVAAGRPLLVLQDLGAAFFARWHYAVVVGVDSGRDEVFLRSGTDRRRVMELDTFLKTWRRGEYWALVVLRPDELPEDAPLEARLESREPLPPCTSATRRDDIGGLPPREPHPIDLAEDAAWTEWFDLERSLRGSATKNALERQRTPFSETSTRILPSALTWPLPSRKAQ